MKLNIKKLQPLAGYILVEPSEKDTVTASGIVLPTNNNEKPSYGKILAIGADRPVSKKNCDCGCEEANLSAKDLGLKIGDMVVYKKWGGNELKVEDVEYQILKVEDILAKIN